jgi:hypothetical protein
MSIAITLPSLSPAPHHTYGKLQIDFNINGVTFGTGSGDINPYAPEDIDVSVIFTHATGASYTVNAFYAVFFTRNLNLLTSPDPTNFTQLGELFHVWLRQLKKIRKFN